jgi:DNA-binding MarR family transcriptional regulator
VLGAIALSQQSLTVPQIARRMGLTRQSVHTTVNRLLEDGLVELVPNADHRRSQLVRLTGPGEARYRAIDAKQAVWVNELVVGLRRSELKRPHACSASSARGWRPARLRTTRPERKRSPCTLNQSF